MGELTDRHPGTLPGQKEFLSVSAPNVDATVLKMAEKEKALELRPSEIKTFLLPFEKNKPPRIVNLLEE